MWLELIVLLKKSVVGLLWPAGLSSCQNNCSHCAVPPPLQPSHRQHQCQYTTNRASHMHSHSPPLPHSLTLFSFTFSHTALHSRVIVLDRRWTRTSHGMAKPKSGGFMGLRPDPNACVLNTLSHCWPYWSPHLYNLFQIASAKQVSWLDSLWR